MPFASPSLLRLAASIRLGRGGGLLPILMFHRVLEQPDPLQPEVTTARVFDEQIRMLSQTFNVLPLDQAVQHLKCGVLPARTVCITFDDGYRDNVDVALPILQRHSVSATFFVASGYLNGSCMFNDAVVESIRRAMPGRFDLCAFGLGTVEVGDESRRRALIAELISKIKYFTADKREDFCRALPKLLGVSLPTDVMMRPEHVRSLSKVGMSIGGHTVMHPILANIGDNQARQEIAQNREALKDIVGVLPATFAYPNGKPESDFKPKHAQMVKDAGYVLAVSTAPGVARRSDSLFSLPRFGLRGDTAVAAGMRLLRMTYVEQQPYAA
jgi:peptidoglycan/xylan/chitin deacetylase (PgdA/CDA1 family)